MSQTNARPWTSAWPVPHRRKELAQPLRATRDRRVYLAVKRSVDLVLAALSLVMLIPLMALVALLVRLTSPGPVLFRQTRVGRDGRQLTMLKFRTMTNGVSDELHRDYVRQLLSDDPPPPTASNQLFKLGNDPRCTRIGRFLRRTSIDELPQLLNVLRGDMSLVGPRPVLPWEADLLRDSYADRFRVPPGITGLWQTSGRSTLTMRQALDLDLAYVASCGMLLDLRILLKTVLVVLRPGDAE
jgi:lipopolysaccharide/colanic/teichoic acid biosynthesis glycosyltransferase